MNEQDNVTTELDEMDQGFAMDPEERQPEARSQESQKAENSGQQEQPLDNANPEQDGSELEAVIEQQPAEEGSQSEAAHLEKTPENVANEMEELRKLNPEAARLAMEDSPDGAAIRKRLETFGADYAQDRAESVLEKRREKARQEQEQRARIEEHNRNFRETIRKRNAAYHDLITNGERREEARRYFADVFRWIEKLPYGEAKGLMEIAKRGRDANKVCDLLERYEREKGRPDPTGAYAVTGGARPFSGQASVTGMTLMPAGT